MSAISHISASSAHYCVLRRVYSTQCRLHDLCSYTEYLCPHDTVRNEFDDPVVYFVVDVSSSYRLTEPSGFIHDGLGNYSIGVKCSWLIDARGPYQPSSNATKSSKKKPKLIRLHLEEFATECSWDHLYIYDGDSVQSPLLAVFR